MNIRTLVPFPRTSTSLAAGDPFLGLASDFDRFFGDMWSGPRGEKTVLPRLDVRETERAYVVEAELPGLTENDIDVEANERILTLRGEKKREENKEDKGYHITERSYGSFMRSIQLPYPIDAEKIDGVFEKGVLKLTIPKPEAAAEGSRKVTIKSAA